MFPQFAKASTSWEGHMGGAIAGMLCAIGFMNYGPQRPDPFADEDEQDEEDEEKREKIKQTASHPKTGSCKEKTSIRRNPNEPLFSCF